MKEKKEKNNPEVEAFIVLVANSILFCHAANNTHKYQQSCAKLCGQPLGLCSSQQQHVEGDLGKTCAYLVCQ